MQRTNIYLEDQQIQALDARARLEGRTRAHVIRMLVDRGLAEADRGVEQDLAVIRDSFGVLAFEDMTHARPAGAARQAHLDRLWQS